MIAEENPHLSRFDNHTIFGTWVSAAYDREGRMWAQIISPVGRSELLVYVAPSAFRPWVSLGECSSMSEAVDLILKARELNPQDPVVPVAVGAHE